MTVRVLRVDKIQSNAGIAPHIFVFDAALCTVDEDVPTIVIDPDGRYLWTPVRHQRSQLCKDFLLE